MMGVSIGISYFFILVIHSSNFEQLVLHLKLYIVLFLMQHADMADDSVQLKTLQTILIIFQSRLHPENEVITD